MEKWIMGIFLIIGSVEDIRKKEISGIYLGIFFLSGLAVTYQNKCQKLEISREIVLRFGKCRESPKSQGKS